MKRRQKLENGSGGGGGGGGRRKQYFANKLNSTKLKLGLKVTIKIKRGKKIRKKQKKFEKQKENNNKNVFYKQDQLNTIKTASESDKCQRSECFFFLFFFSVFFKCACKHTHAKKQSAYATDPAAPFTGAGAGVGGGWRPEWLSYLGHITWSSWWRACTWHRMKLTRASFA